MNTKQVRDLWKLRKAMETGEAEKLPKHVAIIMDGNGRWARQHRLSVSRGHRQGTETLREIIRDEVRLRDIFESVYREETERPS